jgi:hypothetical protein
MPDVHLRSIEPLIAIVLAKACGSAPAIVALLGRFLPRLGPLVATQAAFLFVYAVTSAAIPRQIAGHARSRASAIIGSRNLSPEPPVVNDQASSASATMTTTAAMKIRVSGVDIIHIDAFFSSALLTSAHMEKHMEPCIDCGMDTAPNDDRRRRGARTSERYMVRDSVLLAAGMPKREPMEYNILCIGCLEARLGRTLTPRDFTDAPLNRPDRWNSPRLNARLVGRRGKPPKSGS